MIYEFTNQQGIKFISPPNFWIRVLQLAYFYDWKPKGTRCEEVNWDKNYFTNHSQKVELIDSLNIAESLKKSIHNIPDISLNNISSIFNDWRIKEGNHTDLIRFFSGKNKKLLHEFILFCSMGSFIVSIHLC